MGDLHLLNWVRLVVFVFFETTDEHRGTRIKNEERREAVGFLCSWGFFDGNIGRQGGFLIGAKRQFCRTR